MQQQPEDHLGHWWQSRRVRYLAANLLLLFSVLVFFRLVFLAGFTDLEPGDNPWPALSVGVRFDLRLAILLVLPLALMAVLPFVNLAASVACRKLASLYMLVVLIGLYLIYVVDFGHYAYLERRLDSTALRFLEDPLISANMVWQSYPVLWLVLGLIVFVVVLRLLYQHGIAPTLARPARQAGKLQVTIAILVLFLGGVAGLHGRIFEINLHNPVPLRWNDAYISQNNDVNALGLNPILFFVDTFEQREPPYDETAVANFYPAVADYLGVSERENYNLDRRIGRSPHALSFEKPPNVIFIMLESLGASRLGVYGNPLETSPSPNLDKLAGDGWLFRNFFVPVSGTARTVWASLTGLPDVSSVSTSSRNPFITNQRVVLNHFTDHEKLYFIGGAAGWANMSAFIRQSIPDMQLYEEQDWESPIVDVWGISDYDLFREVHGKLKARQSEKPFFAYIQTAGNHRPFTIPENNGDFEPVSGFTDDVLAEAGFRSAAQYNAVRLLDYNVGYFLELAREAGYLDNTIVVMFGDHNNRVTRTPFMPAHFDGLDLDGLHVPFIVYAPGLIQPREFNRAVSLVDVMPTVAGLLGLEYDNTTMGRDIFLPAPEGDRSIYVQTSDRRFPVIGMVNSRFMLRMNRDGSEAKLHPLFDDNPTRNLAEQHPAEFAELKKLAMGMYEMTRYQRYANRTTGVNGGVDGD